MKDNIKNKISTIRRDMARKSLRFFLFSYFKNYAKLPLAQFQLELLDYLQEITEKRDQRFALAAPRGYAKSSLISLVYVLWCVCFGFESCIVIASATEDLAEKLLAHIKEELSSNEDLRQDFPDVCEPPNPRWKKNDIVTKNEVNIVVTSVGKKIRGIRHKEHRPGLIVLDDVENHETVRTAEGRDKLTDWFAKVIMNLGEERTNFIVTGTILHFDSLLSKLILGEDFAGWDVQIYKAVIKPPDRQDSWDQWTQIYRNKIKYFDETGPAAARKYFTDNSTIMLQGTEVLWEAKESFYDLMIIREQRGEAAFLSEKMNEPRSYETIDMKALDYWDATGCTEGNLLRIAIPNHMIEGSCDPAVTFNVRSDFSAIVTVARDRTNQDIYVLSAEAFKVDLDALVKRIYILYGIYPFARFLYEGNAAQAWLGEEIKKQIPLLPLKQIINSEPKDVRISRLMLLIKQGKVKLSKKHSELNRQLSQYPYGAHDDLIDALAMIVSSKNEDYAMDIEQMKKFFAKVRPPEVTTDNPAHRILIDAMYARFHPKRAPYHTR